MPVFRITEGSIQDDFRKSRAKIQIYAGGFANGKTSNSCVKAVQLAQDYPGSQGLIARATLPKLNDTIRKEFRKWVPENAIKSFPQPQQSGSTCTFKNGTQVNFRYVKQQGKGKGQSVSSQLSATYDWIIVDQFDDPEFSYADFTNLIGRLRGSTPYVGDDPTMPTTGPRWMICTLNPTGNWFYKNIIRPLHAYKARGTINPWLKQLMDTFNERDLSKIIDLIEGSTYANRENIPEDYLRSLEGLYTGVFRQRFLEGKWGAYEGLIYPDFDSGLHVVSDDMLQAYFHRTQKLLGRDLVFFEGYDYGMAVPSCYLLGFEDEWGNIFVMDGFYEAEVPIDSKNPDRLGQIQRIKEIRAKYNVNQWNRIWADPALFKRTVDKETIGRAIKDMFFDDGNGVMLSKANNSLKGENNGIVRVSRYLKPDVAIRHPFTEELGGAKIYFSDALGFLEDEISSWAWKRDADDEAVDEPQDKDDHAMAALRYMLTERDGRNIVYTRPRVVTSAFPMEWGEVEETAPVRPWRRGYGRGSAAFH